MRGEGARIAGRRGVEGLRVRKVWPLAASRGVGLRPDLFAPRRVSAHRPQSWNPNMAPEALKSRRRNDYKFQLEYRTRWWHLTATPTFQHALTAARSDNDMYHHMNNSVYYYLYVCLDITP